MRGLIKASGGTDEVLCFAYNSTIIRLEQKPGYSYDCKAYGDEIDAIIDLLANKGYVVRYSKDRFSLTHKGLHPYLFAWEDFKSFMFRSILTPIIVALITSIITNALLASQ